MIIFKGKYYSDWWILYCPTADRVIYLLNLQYNVLLTCGSSVIAEPLVGSS